MPAPSAATASASRRPPSSPPAFERALGLGQARHHALKIDPEAITPMTTLSEIREKALARAG